MSSVGTITKLRMIIVHFLASKDIKMWYREEFTPERYVSPLPFLSLSDCAETSQAHFPTPRKGKMEKDAHGKCIRYFRIFRVFRYSTIPLHRTAIPPFLQRESPTIGDVRETTSNSRRETGSTLAPVT